MKTTVIDGHGSVGIYSMVDLRGNSALFLSKLNAIVAPQRIHTRLLDCLHNSPSTIRNLEGIIVNEGPKVHEYYFTEYKDLGGLSEEYPGQYYILDYIYTPKNDICSTHKIIIEIKKTVQDILLNSDNYLQNIEFADDTVIYVRPAYSCTLGKLLQCNIKLSEIIEDVLPNMVLPIFRDDDGKLKLFTHAFKNVNTWTPPQNINQEDYYQLSIGQIDNIVCYTCRHSVELTKCNNVINATGGYNLNNFESVNLIIAACKNNGIDLNLVYRRFACEYLMVALPDPESIFSIEVVNNAFEDKVPYSHDIYEIGTMLVLCHDIKYLEEHMYDDLTTDY